MSDSQQQQGQTRLLLNIAMVVLETFYSFVLKHDRVVRMKAKKFIKTVAMLMMFVCADSAFNSDAALLYNNVLVIVSLVLTVLMYAFLLFYSAVAITKEEFGRYL